MLHWWTARDQIIWKIERAGTRRKLLQESPQTISDLTLQLPKDRLINTNPENVTSIAVPQSLLIKKTSGSLLLEFETAGTTP